MVVDVHKTFVQVQISASICGVVAVATTLARLWIHRSRMWFDDAWAAFSLVSLIVFIVCIFVHSLPHPERFSQPSRVATYYTIAVSFYGVIWPARLSILFSIIRIDSDPVRRRRMFGLAALIGVVSAILLGQIFWVCEPEARRTGWKNKPNPQCNLGKEVAISQLVTDAIADTILLVAPLRLLRGLLDKSLRRRLMIIFSTCIVTTIVSLIHAAYIIKNGGPKILVAAVVENTTSLIVCNVPVVISALFYAKRSRTHPSNEQLAISTFNLRFAKNSKAFTDDSALTSVGDRGFRSGAGTNSSWSRQNRSTGTGTTTKVATVGITTVTEVDVSPKQPWTFMDDADGHTMHASDSEEKVGTIV